MILVTGGCGFIGQHFVERISKNERVLVLDKAPMAKSLENENVEFIQDDLAKLNEIELPSSISQIVHFAAETHNDSSLTRPADFINSNIMGTFNLIQLATKNDIRFHHVSTDEVFGDTDIDSKEQFSELTAYNPSSPYSASKASSDMLVRAWVRSFGLRATISNTSNNYGRFQSVEKLIPRTAHLALNEVKPKVYGDGKNIRDWIHVEDHVDGILAILERGKVGETYLLGANCERSNLEIVRFIIQHFGLDENFIDFVEDRPGHDRRYAIDASKAQKELGWKPSRGVIENQLPEVLEYYAENRVAIEQVSNRGLSSI